MAGLPFEQALAGKRVLVTGHTGFTGGWACLWLRALGARVHGFALPPETEPSLFEDARIGGLAESTLGDLRDYDAVARAFRRAKPDLVLHLAAQPLVRRSYREPLATFAANALGTAHVLEAARAAGARGVVCVTTDKVYLNEGPPRRHTEGDPLGGDDPYGASKAAAEMAIRAFRQAFAHAGGPAPWVAAARGGNIIGGGDWSEDRLIPDFVRATVGGKPLTLRYPEATRPWQHVLALTHGYLLLLAGLAGDRPEAAAEDWNLGPRDDEDHSVRTVVEWLSEHWRRPEIRYLDDPLPECRTLGLDSGKARRRLGWNPPWDARAAVARTAEWYAGYYGAPASARGIMERQLAEYREAIIVNE